MNKGHIVSSACFVALLLAAGCSGSQKTTSRDSTSPTASDIFPSFHMPLFAQNCFYFVPDGKNTHLILFGIFPKVSDLETKTEVRYTLKDLTPEKRADLMVLLERALRWQEIDPKQAQLVCFPSDPRVIPK